MTQMMPDALESRTISIPGDGRRLDVALSEAAGLTRSRVAALMADGNVTVDGKVETKSGAKAKPGQTVVLMIPAPKPAVPIAQEIPLTILYQDDDLAVVLKPCGMVVHPAAGNEDGTLVNALLHHPDHLSGIGGELPPRHRPPAGQGHQRSAARGKERPEPTRPQPPIAGAADGEALPRAG